MTAYTNVLSPDPTSATGSRWLLWFREGRKRKPIVRGRIGDFAEVPRGERSARRHCRLPFDQPAGRAAQ